MSDKEQIENCIDVYYAGCCESDSNKIKEAFYMEKFKYTREIHGDMNSVLEFETYIDDISVNGVDMIEWNEDGKICNFKVMIRPFKAVQKVHELFELL